ncbi:hypothetical protein [Glycomyces harbinensis]|uniref:Uncharacterized protein n=1 Tax=Glycomyces harbinensis TaxID=58114 RepID=A0A1G6RS90_9ACTN|nr:hypothetical protein [Glycomyces harbinensis]SDD07291.1 hypothetical protein SAMN05216270_101628 [Glycomyces harbinensis]
MRTRLLAAVACLSALAGCGGAEAEPPDVIVEYFDSNEVANDPFPTESCCEDRRAQFAAMGGPDAVIGGLLSVYSCEEDGVTSCELDAAQTETARDFAGDDGELFGRPILVQYADGDLEVVDLYIVQRSDGDTLLIDPDGRGYDGGLDDFRSGNDLFEAEDWIVTAEDIAGVDGGGGFTTVSAKTTPAWVPWAIGAAAALVALLLCLKIIARLRDHREPTRS